MPRLGRRRRIAGLATLLAALGFLLAAAQASAVTIGQLAPSPAPACESEGVDLAQPTVASGAGYVVPSVQGVTAWTIASWATNASAGPGQSMALKVFRKVTDPRTYAVVGHEGPHSLTAGLRRFAADLDVKSGDVLGAHQLGGGACVFAGSPADETLFRYGVDTPDGGSVAFESLDGNRVNITAELTPTSNFSLDKLKRRKNGTAVIALTLPNPGDLTVSGKGVKASIRAVSAKSVNAGNAEVVIRAKGKKKQRLDDSGKVTVKPKITFTPTGGVANTETKKVKLRRK